MYTIPKFTSVDQAVDWANKRFPRTDWRLEGIAPDLVADILRQFCILAGDYPVVADGLTLVGLSDQSHFPQDGHGVMAGYVEDAGEIRLNETYWLDQEKLKKTVVNAICWKQWLPLVPNHEYYASLITHEFAHAVYEAFRYTDQYTRDFQDWRALERYYVCEYAKTNEKELFACTSYQLLSHGALLGIHQEVGYVSQGVC